MSEDLTLDEISRRSGVEPRTLRSWISAGLLAPPYRPGRGARYPAGNLDRALAVRALKEQHGLSLAEIGRRFMTASEDQIRQWAAEAGATTAPPGSAREYVRQIRQRGAAARPPERPSNEASWRFLADHSPARGGRRREAELASLERLIIELERVLGRPASRRARSSVWTRIPVTPNLELSVRGHLEPRERVLFEQLADQLRAILTGRARDD